ncbi:diacylglycerol/lipid kinase family protein [Halobacterium zhouii]|uniref:diacylglycerol/lipid kinase family protein n=1 Tax=Halobacterium zhouii TaxID=2902624 RepID=UPI001E62B89E|nr:diacylglycerol kinase family protein [Halobacterium zhouii]
MDDSPESGRWLVVNPTSGTADHVEQVRELAAEREYRVEETEAAGHAADIAEQAVANDAELLAVAGGDGTLHEVLQGLADADALGAVPLAVIPAGTQNLFATNVGVETIEGGFDVAENGRRRNLDVGFAGDEPFVMSCIAGLPADASVATSDERKERFGAIAFVIAGVEAAAGFDGLYIELTAVSNGEETTWSGDVLCALVGNVRRFVNEGGQANVEDGLFDVVLIEQMPATNIVTEAVAQRLFGQDTEHVVHVQASQLEIDGLHDEPIDFSIDGELSAHDRLVLYNRPRAVTVCVGDNYEQTPTE